MRRGYKTPWGDERERLGFWRGFVVGALAACAVWLLVTFFVAASISPARADDTLQLAWPQLKQSDLPQECQLYPNQPCLVPVEPETPTTKEQREYQMRQWRLRCGDHPEDPKCR